jgi:Cu(I)/Ag(I) efflux system periplasmic protein CusF
MREFLFLAFLSLAGCAAYRLAPLTTDHPAHPDAVAAPQAPVSKTLAYTLSDVPSMRPVTEVTAAQEGNHEAHHEPESKSGQTVVGEGKVVATVPSANQLVVEHGEIKDFMGPMTMGYKIDSPSLLEGLKAGDKIRFTIDVQTKSIVKIEKLNP